MLVGAVEGVVADAGESGKKSVEIKSPKTLVNLSALADTLQF
jgi:hypothetical protein